MAINYDELKRNGFIKQRQDGQFIIRFRSIAGNLTSEDLRALADIADESGKGYVHITTRQGVEIPWIKGEDCVNLTTTIKDLGLNTGASGPRIRTIVACPGCEVCRLGIMNSRETAIELDKEFFGRDVPIKTKIAVSGCPNSCAKPQENDIGLAGVIDPVLVSEKCIGCGLCQKACPNDAIEMVDQKPVINQNNCLHEGNCIRCCPTGAWQELRRGFKLYAGGKIGRKPQLGQVLIEYLEPRDVITAISGVLEVFSSLAQKNERIADVIRRIGVDNFKDALKAI